VTYQDRHSMPDRDVSRSLFPTTVLRTVLEPFPVVSARLRWGEGSFPKIKAVES
jgi:hypothetical protein